MPRQIVVALTFALTLAFLVALGLLMFGTTIGKLIAGVAGLGFLFKIVWDVLLVPVILFLLILALALGATRARALFTVVLPAALPGVTTGILVALARVSGETAPLLFTAFGNRFWSTSLTQPIASLTVQVYTYAGSAYEDWHRQAWAGSLVLVAIVVALSLIARAVTRRMERMHRGA